MKEILSCHVTDENFLRYLQDVSQAISSDIFHVFFFYYSVDRKAIYCSEKNSIDS